MSLRHDVLALIEESGKALGANGRRLSVELSPGASEDRIHAAEATLGFTFPKSYRNFLLDFDGIKLSATDADLSPDADFIGVHSVIEMMDFTKTFYQIHHDEIIPLEPTPPLMLECGRYLYHSVSLKIDRAWESPDYEVAAYVRWDDFMPVGHKIAESFSEWLLTSLRTMARTGNNFEYSVPKVD